MSKKGKLENINIDTADNGYSIRHRHSAGKGGDGSNPMMPMSDNKPHLAHNRADVHAHIDQLMAEHEGGSNGSDDGSHTGQEPGMADQMPDHPMRKLSRRR